MTVNDPSASDKIRPVDLRRAGAIASHAITRDGFGVRAVIAEAAADGRTIELLRTVIALLFEGGITPKFRDDPETLRIIREFTAQSAEDERKENEK